MGKRFAGFDEFWDHYVREHSRPETRRWHFAATSAALVVAAGGLLTPHRWLLLAAPVVGYVPAWLSHLLVEGNRPVSEEPLWALRADLLMWKKTLEGTMDAEVERVLAVERPPPDDPGVNMRTDGTLH